ncbi:DgyrCDS12581 [Dimorphilus gyrociliatus]|uniref:Peroxisomal 2,4-dienoyl-CoA reductase [(3E)-enoyl-CoA-producing] n=1 Tax=Dimorphilus gyrociliatus TaxID=2664684 RepID=A0A7I8W7N6_9ANNE|nr:DgyrCDS12581 [Dimorphilus gyrociliatus]
MQKSNSFNEKCSENYRYFFDKDLIKGKVALITGGGSGIGFSIAEIFLRHGCNVVIASRNLQRVQLAAEELSKVKRPNAKCLGLQLDVRKPENIVNLYESIANEFGRLDVLVNCAAGNFLSPITGLSPNAYRTVLEIDTMGTFLCSKYAFETFFQRQKSGVILNITATLDYRGTPLQAHAGSAKAAIDALTRHMSVEWGSSNVRVVGIAPGATDGTEGLRRLSNPEYLNTMLNQIPLGRLGTRTEIANGALFLISEIAAYITGATLVCDGGHWLTSAWQANL